MFHVRLIYAIIYILLARLLFLTVGRSVTAAVRVEGGPDFFRIQRTDCWLFFTGDSGGASTVVR